MRPTLGNYIDSLNNPNGYFQTLKTVYALRTKEGYPRFTVSSKIVRFDVDWQGHRSLLCCFLSNLNLAKSRYKILALQMESLKSDFLTHWEYLEKEMLVFDERGNSRLCDIILQQEPEGESLDNFIRRCCKQNDGESIRTLLNNVYKMSLDFYDKGFVHSAITPVNIIVTRDLTPVMINYRASHMVSKYAESQKVSIDDDNMSLAILSIILYMVSYQPTIYAEFRGVMLFRKPNLRRILPKLYDFAAASNIEPIKDIVDAILSANDKLKDRQQLNQYIKALIECDIKSYLRAKDKLPDLRSGYMDGDCQVNIDAEDMPLVVADTSKFEWAGQISDTLISVNNNNRWQYFNKDGSLAFNADFDMAEDFIEGRAVVIVKDYYGIIDREGRYVIEPVCEDIVWYGESGVATVSLDGVYGLRDRNGEKITTVEYEWIGMLENGLLPAKLDDKYGFINLKGEVVIEFIYDDAYSFVDGVALVAKDGLEFSIGLKGELIN